MKAKTGHGVKLRSKIVDHAGADTASAPRGSTDLSHEIEVEWLFGSRTGDVKVVSDVVQNAAVATYATPPVPWTADFLKMSAAVPRALSNGLTVSATLSGQVVFDCGRVEVYDIWTCRWVGQHVPAQLSLTIT